MAEIEINTKIFRKDNLDMFILLLVKNFKWYTSLQIKI